MQFTTKNARGRVDRRGVHHAGLPLVLGLLKTSVPLTSLLHLERALLQVLPIPRGPQ
jgi:hypothetical protein